MVRMTSWPNKDHWLQVSATTRPVTQDALVAVNRQFKNGSDCPSLLAKGSISKSVPVIMTQKNPYAINCVWLTWRLAWINFFSFMLLLLPFCFCIFTYPCRRLKLLFLSAGP